MIKIISVEEILDLIKDFREGNKGHKIESNFYGFNSSTEQVILLSNEYGVFFIEEDSENDVFSYFYVSLANALESVSFDFLMECVIKSEYIFNDLPSDFILKHYSNLGFEHYAELKKMSRFSSQELFDVDSRIKLCGLPDFKYLRNMFNDNFDKVSERIPSDVEVYAAIAEASIYKFLDKGKVLGFYWADTKRFVSELRYLFVSEDARGQSIGGKLLQHHLDMAKTTKKNQLWVLSTNRPAIYLYEKYGYIFENQQDYIFRKSA